MSHDGPPTKLLLPVWSSRFWGAEYVDDFIYALVNLLEAIVGVLTLGRYFPTFLTHGYDDWGRQHFMKLKEQECELEK